MINSNNVGGNRAAIAQKSADAAEVQMKDAADRALFDMARAQALSEIKAKNKMLKTANDMAGQ